ncbi:MAG: radical SAM protein [Proteobacteria bacterium]|nr:radical SAM protein [Pseudomonadota bacterium]MBU1232042.1 radical SAM protein [Pseudomonadota bacterium]MBU1416867.1 radical SAM protein [Pseudomonadota bacterium]MBU1454697.1 radical SAM protein [Pseudomonadota bacterium]
MTLVIPVFIPHQGCPCHCLFCNQLSISGKGEQEADGVTQVRQTIAEWLGYSRCHSEVQVAFYGGSFTCLPPARQEELLGAVQPFLRTGEVASIRLSTRPDCVDEKACEFLLENGVRTVELGVQSLDDRVLLASQRGHSSEDSVRAARILKELGMELGIQLMPGLPGETSISFLGTLRQVVELGPAFVRLYPTLVINGSGLAEQYRRGVYRPMTMNRAIALCRRAKEMLDQAGITIIRMGLQASTSLEKELLAGPYHPSFGELVAARHWFRRVRRLLASCPPESRFRLHISDRDLSAFVGPKRINMKRLQELGLEGRMEVKTDKTMQRGTMKYVIA